MIDIAGVLANQKKVAEVYKVIEKMAWITGSLGLVGVILIVFLQGKEIVKTPAHKMEVSKPRLRFSARALDKKPAPVSVQKQILKQEAAIMAPAPVENKTGDEGNNPSLKPTSLPKEKETKTESKPTSVSKQKETKTESKPKPEAVIRETSNSVLFAESELNQLAGLIQAENIRQNSTTNCIQIRITADNNNPQAVAQVERFLASKSYIITGREREDFLKGSGLKVKKQGNCLGVTIGRK